MPARRVHARRFAAVVAVLTVLVLVAVAGSAGMRLPRVSDVWPVDPERPAGWLIDRQLRDLWDDPALCARVLGRPWVEARPIADAAPKPDCGWRNAVEPIVLADVRFAATPVTCELTVALAMWLRHVVQPAAAATLGTRVVAVDHLGSFACRNIRGNPALASHRSEHASANAIDVAGFRLADGRRLRLATDWGRDTAEGRFLAEVHKDGCRYFRVAIGPAYNTAHRDHFHLDRGRWHACR